MSFIAPVRLCNSAPVSGFSTTSPASDSKYSQKSICSSRGSDAPAPHNPHPTKTLRLHQGSPTCIIQALREGGLVRTRVLCVLLMVMVLELLLILLSASGDVGVLIGEDVYDTGGDFVVNDGLLVFAHDIDAGFLLGLIRTDKQLGGLE
jgi:hypothetical protein